MNECFCTFLTDYETNEANGPCADYKPGEDDLQAFDFIRKFRCCIFIDFCKSVFFK